MHTGAERLAEPTVIELGDLAGVAAKRLELGVQGRLALLFDPDPSAQLIGELGRGQNSVEASLNPEFHLREFSLKVAAPVREGLSALGGQRSRLLDGTLEEPFIEGLGDRVKQDLVEPLLPD